MPQATVGPYGIAHHTPQHMVSGNTLPTLNGEEEVKSVYCNSIKEYVELHNKYKDIEIIEFIGVKKPKPEDVAVA